MLFTGEMIYPWLYDTDPALAPLAGAAQILAERDWPPLYDAAALAASEVPAAAVIYFNDMYVPAPLSVATAAGDRRAGAVGDQRVRARRAARQRPGAGPADQPGPRRGVSGH